MFDDRLSIFCFALIVEVNTLNQLHIANTLICFNICNNDMIFLEVVHVTSSLRECLNENCWQCFVEQVTQFCHLESDLKKNMSEKKLIELKRLKTRLWIYVVVFDEIMNQNQSEVKNNLHRDFENIKSSFHRHEDLSLLFFQFLFDFLNILRTWNVHSAIRHTTRNQRNVIFTLEFWWAKSQKSLKHCAKSYSYLNLRNLFE